MRLNRRHLLHQAAAVAATAASSGGAWSATATDSREKKLRVTGYKTHMHCGPIAAAAAMQLDACSPNFLIQEYNTTSLHSEILREPLRFDQGFITPLTGPGLGVELDDKVLARHLSTEW